MPEITPEREPSDFLRPLTKLRLRSHSIREGKNTTLHLRQLMTSYLRQHLPADNPTIRGEEEKEEVTEPGVDTQSTNDQGPGC